MKQTPGTRGSRVLQALEAWQTIRLPRWTATWLSLMVLFAAPAYCALWIQLPLSLPPDGHTVNFPMFLLIFFLYVYQAQWCGFLWISMRSQIMPFWKQSFVCLVLSAIPLLIVILLRDYLNDYYQVIIAGASVAGFLAVIVFSFCYAQYSFASSQRERALLPSSPSTPGAASMFASSSHEMRSPMDRSRTGSLDEPLLSDEAFPVQVDPLKEDDSMQSLASCNCVMRSYRESLPAVPQTREAVIYNFKYSAVIYGINVVCYLWCWVFTYLFINYLHEQRHNQFMAVSWVILFAVVFSMSFVPYRISVGFIIKAMARTDRTVCHLSRDQVRFMAAGLESVAIVFIELIFFVFYRNLFTEIHGFATFMLLEITKYLVEDVFRFLLPLSRRWYDFRIKHLAPIPLLGRLFFRSSADSFEKEVYGTALAYSMHMIANGASGVCYLVMLFILRHNTNKQFYPYGELTSEEFTMLVSFYGISFAMLIVNFALMQGVLTYRHSLDMFSVGWMPFVKNRVALITVMLLAPHVMQDVYLAMIGYKS
jgi:hypothetical protein